MTETAQSSPEEAKPNGKARVLNRDTDSELDVLEDLMWRNYNEIPQLIIEFAKLCRKRGDYKEAVTLLNRAQKCEEVAIDCASKLAPYRSPKLESVSVNQAVEHKYVMLAPPSMSWDEWARHCNATELSIEEMKKEHQSPQPKKLPSFANRELRPSEVEEIESELEADDAKYYSGADNPDTKLN